MQEQESTIAFLIRSARTRYERNLESAEYWDAAYKQEKDPDWSAELRGRAKRWRNRANRALADIRRYEQIQASGLYTVELPKLPPSHKPVMRLVAIPKRKPTIWQRLRRIVKKIIHSLTHVFFGR